MNTLNMQLTDNENIMNILIVIIIYVSGQYFCCMYPSTLISVIFKYNLVFFMVSPFKKRSFNIYRKSQTNIRVMIKKKII